MKKVFLIISALLVANVTFASGGMIGGGDVDFKSLMVCDSNGIDPTHSGSHYVWVVKEVDYNGHFIADATLRVVTLDSALKPTRYYVTHSMDLLQNPGSSKLNLELWRYDLGSSGNKKIGSFTWDEKLNAGAITSVNDNSDVEELELSNCISIR